jgi:hypothetical protein
MSDNGRLGTGTIAGISVGVVASIVILGLASFALFKQYRKRKIMEQEVKALQESNQWYRSNYEAKVILPTSAVCELDHTSQPAELAGQN